MTGPLDADTLRNAVDTVLTECPALHSAFRDDTGAIQVYEITPTPTLVVTAEAPDFVSAWIDEERARPLDIARGPLYRHAVFRFPDGRIGWYQRYHRLIIDQPGMLAILARVRDVLGDISGNLDPNPPFGTPTIRLEVERLYHESGAWAADRDYWEQTLVDAPRLEPLPATHDEPVGPLWAPAGESQALNRIARTSGGGAPAVALAALAVYSTRLTMTRECVIAFDNGETIVPLRIPVQPRDTFDAIAKQVGRELRKARRHRYIPDIDDPWADAQLASCSPDAARCGTDHPRRTAGAHRGRTSRSSHGVCRRPCRRQLADHHRCGAPRSPQPHCPPADAAGARTAHPDRPIRPCRARRESVHRRPPSRRRMRCGCRTCRG
ncbi:condensation domain-containing protein [Nocardia crassostreae]|uniref:condensation domain-containing protein n=1 Tax=Nocardia crassostreae TaxID=53428 RepID=UPI00350E373C